MMDHRAVMASLPAKRRRDLLVRSDRRGLRHLALHWGLILLVGAMIAAKVPFWPLLLPIQGILLIFNFSLLHECTHQTPFRSRWLNEAVGHFCGFVVGLPFLWFRYFHMAHHKYTNDPDRDPELAGQSRPRNWCAYLWRLTGLPVWAAQITGLFRIAAGQDKSGFVPKSRRRAIQVESIIFIILYALTVLYSFTISINPLILWIIPVILGQPFLRLYLMAEHGRCPPVADMLQNSRTVLTNRVIRFLAWNMPYHVEHHTAPNVPFYLLPALHQDIKSRIGFLENGYGRFHAAYVKQFEAKRELRK